MDEEFEFARSSDRRPKEKTQIQQLEVADFNSSESDFEEALENRDDNMWFGVKIKKQFGLGQWLVIPVSQMGLTIVGVYMNAQLAFMLSDKSMFAIGEN